MRKPHTATRENLCAGTKTHHRQNKLKKMDLAIKSTQQSQDLLILYALFHNFSFLCASSLVTIAPCTYLLPVGSTLSFEYFSFPFTIMNTLSVTHFWKESGSLWIMNLRLFRGAPGVSLSYSAWFLSSSPQLFPLFLPLSCHLLYPHSTLDKSTHNCSHF